MKYAEQEGMQLIWDLNQDFIIRHRFLSENSLVATLDEIAGAIDANFIPQVNVYFCNKKRTIVIAENAGTYVIDNCKKAGFD
jgi:phage-related protein